MKIKNVCVGTRQFCDALGGKTVEKSAHRVQVLRARCLKHYSNQSEGGKEQPPSSKMKEIFSADGLTDPSKSVESFDPKRSQRAARWAQGTSVRTEGRGSVAC